MEKLKIAVIGAGRVGGVLAKGWAAVGHDVIAGGRDPGSDSLRALASDANIRVATIPEAAAASDVLLIATPPEAARSVADAVGPAKEKIIIDATNSIRGGPEGHATVADALATWLPDADVVKCFNTTGFENMANPRYGDVGIDMFMAGDGKRGKEIAARLALDLGFEQCIDFGGSDKFVLLEHLALCWINLAIMRGEGRDIAFKLLRR